MMNAQPGIFTKNDYAYARLRELILTGELPPGSQLQQGQLAKDLGVSTTPLREAIRRLTAEGLINLAAHRDARVSEVTGEEATYLYEVREQLDPLAAALAASRRTSADLEAITAAEHELRPLSSDAGLPALLAHREFHRAIYTASHNPILVDLLERLWDKADRYRLIGLRSRGDSETDTARVADEHRELVESIEAGDPDGAEETMRRHIGASLGRRAITTLEAAGAPEPTGN